jgi:hypothetical protein
MILVKRKPGDSTMKLISMYNQRTRRANQKNRFKLIQIAQKPLSDLKKKLKKVKKEEYLKNKAVADRSERSKF